MKSDFPFISCEIASRLTPFQKQVIAEELISRYLLIMESPISTESENDVRQDEMRLIRHFMNAAGLSIQLIEKI